MLIPIVFGAIFLGRAFDMKSLSPTSRWIFDNDVVANNLMVSEVPFTRSEYKLVESSSDVQSVLDVSGELSLKAKNGNVNLRGSGSYFVDTVDREKTVELLLTVNHQTVAESFPSYIQVRNDWQDRPQSEVGTHYIRTIVYGGQLMITYQLRTNSSENLEEIKAAVNAHLEVSGSLNADVKGKLEKIDKAVRSKSTTYIHAYYTAGIITQPQNLEDTFKLIDEYPSVVNKINGGKGSPIKIELVPLSTLSEKFEGALKSQTLSEVVNDAMDKFDDLKTCVVKFKDWIEQDNYPEEMESEISAFESRMKTAQRKMSRAISKFDLSKPLDINYFDEAIKAYAEGGINIPNRYNRELAELINKALNIKPKWYAYTRAVTHYIHWGSVNCTLPSPEPLLVGLAAASPIGLGNGANLQCLSLDPQLDTPISNTRPSTINGLSFVTPDTKTGPLFCARCKLENATTTVTVLAQEKCPVEMKLEYSGYLATGSKAISEPICIDLNPDDSYGGVIIKDDRKANILRPMQIKCKDCYDGTDKYIPCVVCSR